MVIDDAGQINLVHALEVEREDVDLPHSIGRRPFKAPDFGRAFVGLHRRVADTGGIDCLPDLLRTDGQAFVHAKFIADAAHAVLRVVSAVGNDTFLQFCALFADFLARWFAAETTDALFAIRFYPRADGVGLDAKNLGNILPISTAIDRFDGKQLRFKRDWRAAVDLFTNRNGLAGIQRWGCGFLWFVLIPE